MTSEPPRAGRPFLKAAIAVGLLAAVAVGFWLARKPRPTGPNVILISIDSLRPDHLKCYGYARETSPTIDRLAAEGALFETAVSSTSWTLPAHAALFTGLPDRVHGCYDDERWLAKSRLTLAEQFQEAGYVTAGFFSGPYLHPSFGLAQGFDRYQDCTSYSEASIEHIKKGTHVETSGLLAMDLMKLSHGDVTNPIVLDHVKKWLAEKPAGPFFLFIHLWDVHYDYLPPPPYDTMFDPDYRGPVNGRGLLSAVQKPAAWTDRDVEHLKALYDGEIRATDAALGEILAELERRGLKETSVIAVTADHGEAFYEHGLFGHRWTLHEEETRIPLVIRHPGRIPAGRRVRDQASIMDIAPTLLELVGLAPLPAAVGRSLVPALGPEGQIKSLPTVLELNVPALQTHLFALRTLPWKLIYDLNRRQVQAYDLAADPRERAPLPPDKAPVPQAEVGELYQRKAEELDAAARRLPPVTERDTPPIPTMTKEQLRALGYLK